MKHIIYFRSAMAGFEYRRELSGGDMEEHFSVGNASVVLRSTRTADDIKAVFIIENGEVPDVVSGVESIVPEWTLDNYLLIPAAVYNSNRTEVRSETYPPFNKEFQVEIDPPFHSSNIPHFDLQGGGTIEQTTGDAAFPGVGYYSPAAGETFWFLTPCCNELGNYGYTLMENIESGELYFTITSPVFRRFRQDMCRPLPAEDKAAYLKKGDKITFAISFSRKKGDSVSSLFAHMAEVRNIMMPSGSLPAVFPMSQADRMIKKKFCASNWDQNSGYFMTATDINAAAVCSHWQLGWCGGGMYQCPMAFDEDPEVRQKAWQDAETLYKKAQSASGLYYGAAKHGKYYCDSFSRPFTDHRLLLRKNADVLFWQIKFFMMAEEHGETVDAAWKASLLSQALAIGRIWETYHQFGQWVNVDTGEIITGGSASAVMAIGGLALAAKYFKIKKFIDYAGEAAEYYTRNFLEKGILNGCPGEILQACDSEAGSAMLESMMTLWEITGKSCYLEWAEKAALYCMSWCVSYDYKFPPESPFGKLDLKSAGTVWANVQNKHSAPGFCTSSGSALLRLFRATGKRIYMDMLRDIAHALPQFVSRPGNRIAQLEDGWINERVNLSDWEGAEMVGNVFHGSCWPEVTLMLSYWELPGVYVRKDTGDVWCLDHVEAKCDKQGLVITNPTPFTAHVKVLSEDDNTCQRVWDGRRDFAIVELQPGESCRI